MKIAICDDQQGALEHTVTKVRATGFQSEIKSFLKISDLYQTITEGENFNTVLMDIEWEGEQRGIDFASELLRLSPKTKIIFVTGYPERYSQQIFLRNTNLKGFLSKPIDTSILLKILEKINDEIIHEENRKLVLKFNGNVVAVEPDDIIYIESRAHTATVHSMDGGHLCYEKLENLANRLPGQFILTHKSFLVNMDRIRRIERERVILEKGMEIPISKSRYSKVSESYFRYIRSTI